MAIAPVTASTARTQERTRTGCSRDTGGSHHRIGRAGTGDYAGLHGSGGGDAVLGSRFSVRGSRFAVLGSGSGFAVLGYLRPCTRGGLPAGAALRYWGGQARATS